MRRVCAAAMTPSGGVTTHVENRPPSSATMTGHTSLMDSACLLRPVKIMRSGACDGCIKLLLSVRT